MKTRAFTPILFISATVWAAFGHWRVMPAFACMALGHTCLVVVLFEARRGREKLAFLWNFIGFDYLGLALLIASVAGPLTSGRFWIVFAAEAAVVGPVVLLARRLFLPQKAET